MLVAVFFLCLVTDIFGDSGTDRREILPGSTYQSQTDILFWEWF